MCHTNVMLLSGLLKVWCSLAAVHSSEALSVGNFVAWSFWEQLLLWLLGDLRGLF
jgi:hypothetical protein